MSYLLSNSRLDIRLNNKKTAKTVRLIKKPVDESLYDEFSINRIFGLPFRNKITANIEHIKPKTDRNKYNLYLCLLE